jgi:hypothetical protein
MFEKRAFDAVISPTTFILPVTNTDPVKLADPTLLKAPELLMLNEPVIEGEYITILIIYFYE